jgi:nucleoside-triphosphatase THEP1
MTKENIITITVTGAPGVGKSSVANTIAIVLKSIGFEVDLIGRVTMREPEQLDRVIENIVKSTSIQINEIKPRRKTDEPK